MVWIVRDKEALKRRNQMVYKWIKSIQSFSKWAPGPLVLGIQTHLLCWDSASPAWLFCVSFCGTAKWISYLSFSRSAMCDSLRPHGPYHARFPCPSPSPGLCSNLSPLSWWCHPTVLSSVESAIHIHIKSLHFKQWARYKQYPISVCYDKLKAAIWASQVAQR